MLTRSPRDWCNHTPGHLPLAKSKTTINCEFARLQTVLNRASSKRLQYVWTIIPPKPASHRYVFRFLLCSTRRELSHDTFYKNSSWVDIQLRHDSSNANISIFYQNKEQILKKSLLTTKLVQKSPKIDLSWLHYSMTYTLVMSTLLRFPSSWCSQSSLLCIIPIRELVSKTIGATKWNVCICVARHVINKCKKVIDEGVGINDPIGGKHLCLMGDTFFAEVFAIIPSHAFKEFVCGSFHSLCRVKWQFMFGRSCHNK